MWVQVPPRAQNKGPGDRPFLLFRWRVSWRFAGPGFGLEGAKFVGGWHSLAERRLEESPSRFGSDEEDAGRRLEQRRNDMRRLAEMFPVTEHACPNPGQGCDECPDELPRAWRTCSRLDWIWWATVWQWISRSTEMRRSRRRTAASGSCSTNCRGSRQKLELNSTAGLELISGKPRVGLSSCGRGRVRCGPRIRKQY